jgi:hypothetical protein
MTMKNRLMMTNASGTVTPVKLAPTCRMRTIPNAGAIVVTDCMMIDGSRSAPGRRSVSATRCASWPV